MYRTFVKRILDFCLAIMLLLALSPIFFIIVLLLFVANNGAVFFVQVRPGYKEKLFSLLKFKTMTDKQNEGGDLLSDDQRLTWVGKWVRKLSLDELPQLINVLRGDMSLIGPRPWLVEYIPLYNEFQRMRNQVRPGITGWAQVNGRNMTTWEKRFEFDVYYVNHLSFSFDLKIFFITIWNILTAKGISGEDTATMKKFEGNV